MKQIKRQYGDHGRRGWAVENEEEIIRPKPLKSLVLDTVPPHLFEKLESLTVEIAKEVIENYRNDPNCSADPRIVVSLGMKPYIISNWGSRNAPGNLYLTKRVSIINAQGEVVEAL